MYLNASHPKKTPVSEFAHQLRQRQRVNAKPRSGRPPSPTDEKLAEFIVDQGGTYFIVAELPPHASREAYEDTLYHWIGRINRKCTGPQWWKDDRRHLRMTGFVIFETRGNLHAHLIVKPPKMADLNFWPDAVTTWKDLAPRGTMKIKPVWFLAGAVAYDLKDLNWTQTIGDTWMFIDDLSRRPVRRLN